MVEEGKPGEGAHGPPPRKASPILQLTFGEDRSFETDLRRRVDAYFVSTGRSKKGSPVINVKACIILASFVASYLLLVFWADTLWQGLALSVLLGFSVAAIGFNIAHDGGHGAFSESHLVNRLAAVSMDLVGVSSYVWYWKHVVIHHRYVNIVGYDTDIDIGILGRLTPYGTRLPFHRWQHLYLWPLYGFLAAKMEFVDDFKRVMRGRIGRHGFPRPRGADLAIFIGGKLFFVTWAFLVPLLFHGPGTVLFFYAVSVSVLGIMLSLVFQLPHCVKLADFIDPPAEGRIATPWAVHQAQVTIDFDHKSPLVRWLLGGLNFHLEHHLFPTICHTHHPALAGIVEGACRDHGVKYGEHPSFGSGVASHYQWLRLMGAGR